MSRVPSPLPQLQHPQDHVTFGISFLMKSDIPKILLPLDLDKEPVSYIRFNLGPIKSIGYLHPPTLTYVV